MVATGQSETSTRTATIPVTVDVVLFSIRPDAVGREALHVLLIRRAWEPFAGCWALPGDYVRLDESLGGAAARALTEKAGLRPTYLEQLYTFGRPDRGAKERVITVAHYALARVDEVESAATRPDSPIRWWPVDRLPDMLAFDQSEIVGYALWRLRNKVGYAHVAFQFLPPTFTLAELRAVYEVILGKRLDPANFRRHVLATGTIVSTREQVAGGRHRPPRLYRCAVTPNELYQGPPS
jgi:ADP-ribose pyrophosphatase YjhB (NUDIX family)